MKTIFAFALIFLLVLCFQLELIPQSFTASHNKSLVDSLAHKMNSNNALIGIGSDSVSQGGAALYWAYIYESSPGNNFGTYYFHTTIDSAVYDSSSKLILVGSAIFTEPWIDSDSALALAEQQGGQSFRINNPFYKIKAALGEPVVPYATPRWYITYVSFDNPDSIFSVNLDAANNRNINSIIPVDNTGLKNFMLYQNFPNPFNPTTIINYSIPKSGLVTIIIYDIHGREIKKLVNEEKSAGNYSLRFSGANLSSGIYFYRMQSGSFVETKKLILLK